MTTQPDKEAFLGEMRKAVARYRKAQDYVTTQEHQIFFWAKKAIEAGAAVGEAYQISPFSATYSKHQLKKHGLGDMRRDRKKRGRK